MSNRLNKMLLHSEHIPCIPMVQQLLVHTSQPCQIKWYCIYPIYQWFGSHMSNRPNKMLLHSEHITYILLVQKLLVHRFQACLIQFIALQVYTLYTNGSEIVSLHISTMPNKTCGSGPLLCMAGYSSLQVNTEHECTHSLRCKLCIIIIRFWELWGKGNVLNPWSGVQGYEGSNI